MSERRAYVSRVSRVGRFAPLLCCWLLAYGLLSVFSLQNSVPYSQLLLDPSHALGAPWYTGIVSNLGVLGWSAAAVSAAGASLAARGRRQNAERFLRSAALLSTLMMIDDLFQLHALTDAAIGVPKMATVGAYGALALGWFALNIGEIRRTRIELLIAAGAMLTLSVLFDRLGGVDLDRRLILEDTSKFVGILTWALYFALTANDITKSILQELDRAASPHLQQGYGAGRPPLDNKPAKRLGTELVNNQTPRPDRLANPVS